MHTYPYPSLVRPPVWIGLGIGIVMLTIPLLFAFGLFHPLPDWARMGIELPSARHMRIYRRCEPTVRIPLPVPRDGAVYWLDKPLEPVCHGTLSKR